MKWHLASDLLIVSVQASCAKWRMSPYFFITVVSLGMALLSTCIQHPQITVFLFFLDYLLESQADCAWMAKTILSPCDEIFLSKENRSQAVLSSLELSNSQHLSGSDKMTMTAMNIIFCSLPHWWIDERKTNVICLF